MTESKDDAAPGATVAFGQTTADPTERFERPGMAPALDAEADAARGGVLPPLATTEIDASPLRGRFASGGE